MPDTDNITEVADGIYCVYLPLPFALRIANCYLLRGSEGWTVVDTGIHTPDGKAAWHEIFTVLEIRPQDVEQIVITHAHPDHYGLAGWLQNLCAENGNLPPVRLSSREAKFVRDVWQSGDRTGITSNYLISCGMPDEQVAPVKKGVNSTLRMTLPHPTLTEYIEPGEILPMGERRFRVIHAPGHNDGHLLFYDPEDKLMLCGDHVLVKITPNIGLWPATDPAPLERFMVSMRELQALDVRLALPGHRALITDWRGRLGELLAHHEERLEHTLDAMAGGAETVYEISLEIFESGAFSPHEWRFAVAETLAHLEYLRLQGSIIRENGQVQRFRCV